MCVNVGVCVCVCVYVSALPVFPIEEDSKYRSHLLVANVQSCIMIDVELTILSSALAMVFV